MSAHPRVPSISTLLANLAISTPSSVPLASTSTGSRNPTSSAVVDWSDPNSLSSIRAHNSATLQQWREQQQTEKKRDDSAEDERKEAEVSDALSSVRAAEWARTVRSYVNPFSQGRVVRPVSLSVTDGRGDDEEERRWKELEKREEREREMRRTKEERKEERKEHKEDTQPTKAVTAFPRPTRLAATPASSSSSLSATSGRRDFRWLLARCESVAHDGSAMTSLDLASSTLQLLQSKKSDDQLQSDLIDLLGMEGIELVGEMLQHRQELRRAAVSDIERSTSPQPAAYSSAPRAAPPQLLGVSVTSQRAKDEAKAQRKEDRRMARLTSKDTSADFVARQQQADAERLEEQARSLDEWRSAAVTEKSNALPAGSTRTEHKGYEEVFIPPTLPALYDKEDLVPISSLDAWARPVFGTTTHLNRIQSKCYQAAYKHNNNVLVCAPTGSGKASQSTRSPQCSCAR